MASVEINRLMDNARIKLPGALDATLKLEFFAVMNEFLTGTNIWYEDIQFPVSPTTATYLEDPEAYTYDVVPSQGGIIRLYGVVDSKGFPVKAYMPILGSIVLDRAPSDADTYTARVLLTVTDPVTREDYPQFPTWLLDKYGNEILDGILARMMSQIAKPYSSTQMAQYHMRKFLQGVGQARVEAMHQNVYRGQNWRFPQTFARRRFKMF